MKVEREEPPVVLGIILLLTLSLSFCAFKIIGGRFFSAWGLIILYLLAGIVLFLMMIYRNPITCIFTTIGCIIGTILGEVIGTAIQNEWLAADPRWPDRGDPNQLYIHPGPDIWFRVVAAAIVIGLVSDLLLKRRKNK